MRQLLMIVLVFLFGFGAAGCERWAVRPDEKEYLADPIMQIQPDQTAAEADQHVLTNREGSSGGFGAAGGGCGCN